MSLKTILSGFLTEVESFFETVGKEDVAAAEPILENTLTTLSEAEVANLVSGNTAQAGPIAAKVLTAAAPQLEGIAVNSTIVALNNVTAAAKAKLAAAGAAAESQLQPPPE